MTKIVTKTGRTFYWQVMREQVNLRDGRGSKRRVVSA